MIDKSAVIHSTAIVSDDAVIGPGVTVGPWTIIGSEVEIGEGTSIASHCVIKGPVKSVSAIRYFSLLPSVRIVRIRNTPAKGLFLKSVMTMS